MVSVELGKSRLRPNPHMLNYLFDRYEHNIEQKLWVCWLFGTTYYAPTAWVIWNEFPDFELVGSQRLEGWNSENYRRLEIPGRHAV